VNYAPNAAAVVRQLSRFRYFPCMATKKTQALSRTPSALQIASIERTIYFMRGQKIIVDADLARLYHVPTFRLNEQVKRNRSRFPKDFMFQLTAAETSALRSQIAMSNSSRGGRRYRPYAFTEPGVAMLSSVLRSGRAVQVNIAIMRAFVKLREILATHRELGQRLKELEGKFQQHDGQIQEVFEAIRALLAPRPDPGKRRIGFPS
jgi:ORF6N domain